MFFMSSCFAMRFVSEQPAATPHSLTVSRSCGVGRCADLLRHPWTVGTGNPAEFDELISQMDEMMVHDEAVKQKLDAMVRHAHR